MSSAAGERSGRSLPYRADIDGLRGLAVLVVVLFHAKLGCGGGFVGVDVFFVISGFLITSLVTKELRQGTFSLVAFWERRIRRIFPALAVMVLATLIAGWFLYLPDDFKALGKSVVAQTTLLSNIYFWTQSSYFSDPEAKPLLHTWSLAVEEQFYLLFPLLLLWLSRFRKLSLSRVIAVLGLGSLVLSIVGTYYAPTPTFYLLPTRAWELLLGAYLAATKREWLPRKVSRATVGWLGLMLIGVAVFWFDDDTPFPGWAAILPCLGAALVILSGTDCNTQPARALSARPLVFVGLISYSLYLWHWPLLVMTRYSSIHRQEAGARILLLVASMVLAVLSWRYIETPFRKRWIGAGRGGLFGLAGLCSAALLAGGIAVWTLHGVPARFSALALRYADDESDRGAFNDVTLEDALGGKFVNLGEQQPTQPIKVMIWGDSHARTAAPILDVLCKRFGQRGVLASFSATPPIMDYASRSEYGLRKDSPAFARAIIAFIAEKKVEKVILAAHWSAYPFSDSFKNGLLATVEEIRKAGAKVYILKDAPDQNFNVPKFVALTVLHGGDLEALGTSRLEHRQADRKLRQLLAYLPQDHAVILDPAKYFLNRQQLYGVIKEGRILYYDAHHLTKEGSKLMSPLFTPLFSE